VVWHLTDDVERFDAVAGDFLRSRPVEHTVPLTLVETLRSEGRHAYGPGDPIFAWSDDSVGAALQTPPHPLLVVAAPDVAGLVALLAGRPLEAVNAPDDNGFVEAWCARTGAAAVPLRRIRLYRLNELTPPVPAPPGAARLATAADRELLLSWVDDFQAEIGDRAGRSTAQVVDSRLADRALTLWEKDGTPVSLVGNSPLEAGMVRVTMVYTPPALRGHGYAAGATTAVSRAALDAGAEHVVLFTDTTNATSNALYQRLGYRPVADRSVVRFFYA
jgi:ribosomal protein S18 acetylase RimI-like enzyme